MQRILLAGGGHTHLAAAAALATRVAGAARITLISESPRLLYSGSMPGWLAGRQELADCEIDLTELCRRSGIEWIRDTLTDIDFKGRCALGLSGQRHGFDLLSLNLGSATTAGKRRGEGGHDRPSGPVLPVKPFGHFAAAWQRWLSEAGPSPHCVVVGGGAAGFEIACALRARFASQEWSSPSRITLASESPRLLASQGRLAGWLAARALRRLGIACRLRWRFEGWQGGEALFTEFIASAATDSLPTRERRVRADLVILATGARPPQWLSHAARRDGLMVAVDGGIQVGPDLRAVGSPAVWASGDCATLVGPRAVPKSGVHALKQAPTLVASIAAVLRGTEVGAAAGASGLGVASGVTSYRPQRHALQLLDSCDGSGIASWGPLAASGSWTWHWKRRIDTGFLEAARGVPGASG